MSLQFVHSHYSSKNHSDTIWATIWLESDTVVSISSDGTAVHWDAATGQLIKSLPPHALALTSLSADAKGTQALINSIEGTVILWDLTDGHVVGTRETFNQTQEGIDATWSVSLHPKGGSYASTGASGSVKIHSVEPDVFGRTLDSFSPQTSGRNKFGLFVKYSPNGQSVALSTEYGNIYVFDVEKKTVIHSFSSHATSVRSLAWSADSQLLMSASDDRRLVLYDTRTASASSANSSTGVVASLTGHSSWVLSADISPDGRLAASGSSDQTVKIWDIATRQCVSTLTDQSGDVWGVSWRPIPGAGAGTLVSSGDDGRLRWWRSAGAGAATSAK